MPHSVRSFLSRKDFPKDFTIGAATSAFQIEGAAHEDGKGLSIWDKFCEKKGYNMGKAIDHYHRYKEDVAMMKWLGLDAYGFSISWSRILPTGRKSGGLNFEGVKFYKDLIKELLANGIKPHATLFYWDVPQALEEKYGGFRDSQIVDDFGDYADICFMIFGNDVKHWTTINKPGSFSEGGYAFGILAPGRGDNPDEAISSNPEGDPAREPYIVTHNLLLAHAKAVEVYRTRYQGTQDGLIGIALLSFYFEPASKSEKDKKAKERALDFTLNRFLDPITVGHYPNGLEEIMKARNIDHDFSQKGSGAVKGSIDFLGLDYYTANYVRDTRDHDKDNDAFMIDHHFEFLDKPCLGENWPGANATVYPQGLKDVLIYVKSKYNGPIYITENGFGEKHEDKLLRHEAHHDIQRFSYMNQHLSQIMEIAKENAPDRVDVRGYFAWTLWDSFDFEKGFDVRYGIIHVDFENNLKRTPKFSAHWLKYILQKQPRKKRRQPGLIKAGTGPRVSTRSLGLSSVSTRSLQPQATDRAVGMSATSFASDKFSTRSASSLGSNAFGRTSSNISQRQLESEYEEDEDYEDDEDYEEDEDDESNIKEDEKSDEDSEPAHGSLDREDEDSDVNSAPIRPVARRSF